MAEKTFSNILYLTSACQLACKYCYEADKRRKLEKDFWISDDQLKEALDFFKEHNIENRNVLLFGGEPLLAWDKIKFAVDYVLNTLKFDNFGFDVITNGIKLADEEFFAAFFDLFSDERLNLKLEISYDGKGQSERVFPDNSSSELIVQKAINDLEANDKPFYLRYTLNTTTYDIIEEELIYFLEKYKFLQGITVNVAASNLDQIEGNYIESVAKKAPYLRGIWEMYHKPICDFTCDLCKYCHPTDFNMHYVPGIGNKISAKDQGSFDRWNPLFGEKYERERYDLEGRSIGIDV